MFYVCENQLVFFPFINAVIYSIHPFSIRPGQGCRAPLRGVPGGGLRFGLCFCGLVFLPKKNEREEFFTLHHHKPPSFFCFFFGGPKKKQWKFGNHPSFVHPLQLGSVSPATLRELPWRWRKPMRFPWMWRMPWWRRSGRQWKLHCRNLDRWKFGSW